MATNQKVLQIRWMKDNSDFSSSFFTGSVNIFNNLVEIASQYFYGTTQRTVLINRIGIQGLPGVRFYLNEGSTTISTDGGSQSTVPNKNHPVLVGGTGMFELDLSKVEGVVTSFYLDENDRGKIDKGIIIDLICTVEEGIS